MSDYYVTATAGSGGSGTLLDPWKIDDLLDSSTWAIGPALTTLQAGDTLYFRGGSYHFTPPTFITSSGQIQLIYPDNSGTAPQPITLRNYPGETPLFYLDGSNAGQPLFGTNSPARDYVRFLGLTVSVTGTHDFGLPYGTNAPAAFCIGGSGNEVGYCEVVGGAVTTTDNHDGIFVAGYTLGSPMDGLWIHHNNIHGITGASGNSSGMTIYGGTNIVVEDNWFHGNTCPAKDKDGGNTGDGTHNTIWRRNYLQAAGSGAPNTGWSGCAQGDQAALEMYDNWMENATDLNGFQTDSQFYNNILTNLNGSSGHGLIATGQSNGGYYSGTLWNNVVNAGGASFDMFATSHENFADGPFAYLDYNVYTGSPWYEFPDVTYDLTGIRAQLFEQNTGVVSALTDVYVDTTDYVLKTAYQTAGRYGDEVGPRVAIGGTGGLLDTTRYGPAAFTPTPTPTPTPTGTGINSGMMLGF